MDCVNCKEPDVFNRVIVNQLTGEELGLYCEDCESHVFGTLLDQPAWQQDNGCAFCDGDGKYTLPKIDCLIERNDGSPRLIEYMPVDEPVALCTDHLQELLPTGKRLEELESPDSDTKPIVEA